MSRFGNCFKPRFQEHGIHYFLLNSGTVHDIVYLLERESSNNIEVFIYKNYFAYELFKKIIRNKYVNNLNVNQKKWFNKNQIKIVLKI
jgi:hypothetical protein